jgi:1-acyl-sn-glycerol-3-phosphate acyltransferase
MLLSNLSGIINHLPKGLVSFIANKWVNAYINKYANIRIKNEENITAAKKPVIFVCNHLSNSDALILNRLLKKYDTTFVAGVKLGGNAFTSLGLTIVKTTPIQPDSPDKEGIKKIVDIVKGGGNILIFPEGTRSRTGKMIKAKKGIVLIAKLCKVPIIPIGMAGTDKLLPVNQEGKMEKEKFYYADVDVNIGKAFTLPERGQGESGKEYEERVLELIMKSIAGLLPEDNRGEYK